MGQIGEDLRLHRESKGISLREVEEATKIRMKYLIALEADDFDALPGKVYVIGFLRTYARFLGINDEEMVNHLKSLPIFGVQEEETKKKEKPAPKSNKSIFLILVIVLALIISGISLTFFRDRDNNISNETPPIETPQEEQEPPNNIPDTSENEDQNDANSESEINGVSVTVIVKESTCWISVKIDGKNNFEGTLMAGENRTFVGQENISIKYGNARVVEAIVNGESTYPVDDTGQVVTKEYSEENIR